MINTIYAKAYTEVLEIIKYFTEEEYAKIPVEKIEFYKNNMDKNYNFKINPEIDLSKQNISKEANAIIVNLFTEYYATEEQKIKIKNILNFNQENEDKKKREKYNPDDIFKKTEDYKKTNSENIKISNSVELIEYKETFFSRFKKIIFKILHISK